MSDNEETKTPEDIRQEIGAVEAGQPPTPPDPYEVAAQYKIEAEKKADIERRIKDYDKLTPKEQFDTILEAQETGLIKEPIVPPGSKYVEGMTIDWSKSGLSPEEITRREARMTELTGRPAGGWGYLDPEQLEEQEKAQAQAQAEYKQRIKAREAIEARRSRESIEFEAANTQLPDGKWITNSELVKMQREAPNIYKALTTSGFAEANRIVADQNAALKELGSYREGVEYYWEGQRMPGVSYDLTRYLLEYPNKVGTPIRAGFDEGYVRELSKAVNATRPYWKEGKLQTYQAYLGGVSPQILQILTGKKEGEIKGKPMPYQQFAEEYRSTHPLKIPKEVPKEYRGTFTGLARDEKSLSARTEYAKYIQEQKAAAAYEKVYGRGALASATGIETATYAFAPARVLEPRVELKDITPTEWVIGGVQLALYTSPLWLPKVIKIAPKLNPVGRVRVTMADGSTKTVWKGVKFWDTPVIGKSGNTLIIGTRGMTYPELTKIAPGWKPVTGLETKVMATRAAMTRMGFGETDITRVMSTLQARGTFAGQQSQYITKEMLIDPTKTLNQRGVEAIVRQAAAEGRNIKVWYGSTAIKQQLAPELRGWRIPADIDIQTTLNLDDTIDLTNRMLSKLKVAQGAKNVRISTQSPTLIEARGVDGQWHHAVDIHALGDPAMSSVLSGEGAYGRLYYEPPVKINYAGSDLRIMSLSESGVRKASSILEWRNGMIQPASHRTKDIVDFYTILQSYEGKAVANEWALAYGYDPTVLAKMALETEMPAISWMYTAPATPISTAILRSVAPILSIISPSLTSAALSVPIGSMPSATPGELPSMVTIKPSVVSAELASINEILPPSSVVSPEVVSKAISQPSAPPSDVVSPPSMIISPTIPSPPSAKLSKAPSITPSVTPVSSIISPSMPPSIPPSPSGAVSPPSVTPSPAIISPSVSPSIPPSYPPSYPPSIPPSYPPSYPPVYPTGYTPPPPPPPLVGRLQTQSPMSQPIEQGSIAWRQGLFWKYIPPPYNQDKPITLPRGVAPKGARLGGRTPQETIQMIGQPRNIKPQDVSIDMGIVDAFITAGGTRITFTGKGLSTNVGQRIYSTTQGMSIGEYPGIPVYGDIKRPRIKKKPKKRREYKNEFSDILEIRGGIR